MDLSISCRQNSADVDTLFVLVSAAPRQSKVNGANIVRTNASAAPVQDGKVTKVIIQGRKLNVTEPIKAYVEGKINRAVGHFKQILKEVDVSLSARGGDTGTHGKKLQKVEITVYTLGNGIIRVEDAEESLYAAIDLAADKLERKLTKTKERGIGKGKWPGRAGPHSPQLDEEEFKQFVNEVAYEVKIHDEQEALQRQFAELNKTFPAQVRRTKKVQLDLMTVDEAIDSMESVGHDFFVFRDMESNSIQIVYRRQAEGYGILVPVDRE